MNSLVIPVYKNEASITELLQQIDILNTELSNSLEVIFVIDASPDNCFDLLKEMLPKQKFKSQLLCHSKNFGSFISIKTGLAAAQGSALAVMAADLQEPISLIKTFFEELNWNNCDVIVGTRISREDPLVSKFFSAIFWKSYRRFIDPTVPAGGVDIFGCNQIVRDHLIRQNEVNSSLIGILFWLGFRRKVVPYERLKRVHGKSAWTFSKKLKYFLDSMYAFTDLPIRFLTFVGGLGAAVSLFLGLAVFFGKLLGLIVVPGYAAVAIMILFFSALNIFILGILGGYIWRTFENTKNRTYGIVAYKKSFNE